MDGWRRRRMRRRGGRKEDEEEGGEEGGEFSWRPLERDGIKTGCWYYWQLCGTVEGIAPLRLAVDARGVVGE